MASLCRAFAGSNAGPGAARVVPTAPEGAGVRALLAGACTSEAVVCGMVGVRYRLRAGFAPDMDFSTGNI